MAMMKILVADPISPSGIAYLKKQPDFEVIEAFGSKPEKIRELVAQDIEAIIVRSETTITAEIMSVGTKLRAIGRAGVGVDNIDVDAATERGIIVMNTPSGNTIATAELTFTHMLCGARPIPQANASMQSGKWNRKAYSGSELRGKTLGVLGMGRIGSEVSKRAQAFDMKILAYDPYLTEVRAKSLGVELANLDTLFAQSDYITVHMPLTENTQYMVDEAAFAKMKKGVRIFNCARGGIIKETALVEALKSGKVAAAGLDVYEDEPLAENSPLRGIENLVLTPHLGASTKEAQESVGIEVAECIAAALRGGQIVNAVNMPSVDGRTLEILNPYLKLGDKLGRLIQQISAKQINKLRITYWGKIIELDAVPLTRAIQRGYLRNICGADVNDVNSPMLMKRLGIEVEVVKSSTDADFTELVRIEAVASSGESTTVSGTLIGKASKKRLVEINGHSLEVELSGTLLIMKNQDLPGIIGKVGTILGEDGVNIANLSLGRDTSGDTAFSVFELDTAPSENAINNILAESRVKDVKIVRI